MSQNHQIRWLSDTLALYIEKSGRNPFHLELLPDFWHTLNISSCICSTPSFQSQNRASWNHYLRAFSFFNIAITSGCVGVNLMPRFNIPITFLAFRSISLAVCSLVSIKWFPAIVYSRSMYSSVIGNISCIRNALSRLSSSLTIWRISQGFPPYFL